MFGRTTRFFFFLVLKEMVLSPNLLINSVPCRALSWADYSWRLAQGTGLVNSKIGLHLGFVAARKRRCPATWLLAPSLESSWLPGYVSF